MNSNHVVSDCSLTELDRPKIRSQWIVDSTETQLEVQLMGAFAMTDATPNPIAGQGVFTVGALNPEPPLIPINSQAWEFIQGPNGVL